MSLLPSRSRRTRTPAQAGQAHQVQAHAGARTAVHRLGLALPRRALVAGGTALVVAAAAVFALTPTAARAAAAVGQPAPDFTLQDTSGRTVKLADFRGKFVVLEWTNPGCPFVRKHYDGGNLPATQQAATAQGVAWLSINSTETGSSDYLEPARLSAWLAERKAAPTAVLMDAAGTAGRAYGARTTPHLYIVNPQGTLVYAGGIDSIASARPADIDKATNHVKAALADIAAARPIATATTQPYGCSIKYRSPA